MIPQHPTIPALILAAGLSSRMGAFKPLLTLGTRPLLLHVIAALQSSTAIGRIIVITGHQSHLILQALEGLPVIARHNPHYEKGEMLSSLRTGLAALPANASAFLLAFADQPAVLPATIRTLVEAHTTAVSPLTLPTFQSKRGHPLILSTTLIPEILALAPTDTLRTIVHRHLPQALLLPIQDPSILEDLDTPEDFAAAQNKASTTGAFFN